MDRFSSVAPARLRVQALPIGRIERRRFNSVLEALMQHAAVVKLADIETPDDQQHLLSPKAYPQGSLLFSYTAFPSNVNDQHLSPFELFREPQLVLGIAGRLSNEEEEQMKELGQAAELLREHYPRVIHRHIILLPEAEGGPAANTENITRVAKSADDESGSALRDAMSEVAQHFLVDFSIYAKAMQASPTIQTPGHASRARPRAWSYRSDEGKPGSGFATPTQSAEISSPTGDDTSRPPSRGFRSPPPATSFDQMQGASAVPSALARSDSRTSSHGRQGGRPDSQDRGSVHGFGQGGSQHKARDRDRGKARVGIVLGHIYLMAGNWSEALRTFVEHTNTVRKLADNLWYAKGLEGIVMCMLLLAWAHLEFSIPSICYPVAERSHSAHVQKLSVNLPSDFRPAEAAHQASVRRLSTSLPDLLKQIVNLYELGEGRLELPTLVLAEVKIRFCNLMATLYQSNNELSGHTLSAVVENDWAGFAQKPPGAGPSGSLSKSSIAAILDEAQQSELDSLPVSDHVAVLTGVYNVYAILDMERKKGSALKDILNLLISALSQACKLGAAEAGIHPAASLSTDAGVDAIVAVTAESGSVKDVIAKIARIYGFDLLIADGSHGAVPNVIHNGHLRFGNDALKLELLRVIAAFCEASPDPQGVLGATATILKSAIPYAAVDTDSDQVGSIFPRDEQIRLVTTISRIIGVSKHLGLPELQVQFWDAFLVRGVAFAPRDAAHNLIPHALPGPDVKDTAQQASGNPLLYDPNAGRHATAIQTRQIFIRNEPQTCYLTLQNPLDVPIELESIHLVTDGHVHLQLETKDFRATTLGSLQLQQVSFSVLPSAIGDFNIVGCRIKIASCGEQVFPIYSEPWAPTPDQLVKSQGQNALQTDDEVSAAAKPKRTIVPATATMTMPLLELEYTSAAESTIMLLGGEKQLVNVVLRNKSGVPATIFNVLDDQGSMGLNSPETFFQEKESYGPDEPKGSALVQPGETALFTCFLVGRMGESKVQLDVYYRAAPFSGSDAFARVLSLPFDITVHPAFILRNAAVVDLTRMFFEFSFDLYNASSKPLSFTTELRYPPDVLVRLEEMMGPLQPDPEDLYVVEPGNTRSASFYIHRLLFEWCVKHDTLEEIWDTLSKSVIVEWREWSPGDSRFGRAHVRNMVLTREQLTFARGRVLRTEIRRVEGGDGVIPLAHASFVRLRLTLVNCTKEEAPPLLVKIDFAPHEAGGRPGFLGLRTCVVPSLAPGGAVHEEFILFPFMAGGIGVTVTVNPVEDWGQDDDYWRSHGTHVLYWNIK